MCVLDLFSESWQSTLFQIFFFHFISGRFSLQAANRQSSSTQVGAEYVPRDGATCAMLFSVSLAIATPQVQLHVRVETNCELVGVHHSGQRCAASAYLWNGGQPYTVSGMVESPVLCQHLWNG